MRYLILCVLLAGCYGNLEGPKPPPTPTVMAGSHAGDPCWVIDAKIPLNAPYQGDTLIVWGHIRGCTH